MWAHCGIFILLADAISPDHQVYRDIPAMLDADQLSQVRIFEGISNFSCKCRPHRQLTCKSLLCETVALR